MLSILQMDENKTPPATFHDTSVLESGGNAPNDDKRLEETAAPPSRSTAQSKTAPSPFPPTAARLQAIGR